MRYSEDDTDISVSFECREVRSYRLVTSGGLGACGTRSAAVPVEVTLSCFSRGAGEQGASASAVVVSKSPYEWHQCMNRWRQVTYPTVPTPILSLSKGGCETWRRQLVLQQSTWDYWLWRQKRLRSFLFINNKQAVRTYVTTSRTTLLCTWESEVVVVTVALLTSLTNGEDGLLTKTSSAETVAI